MIREMEPGLGVVVVNPRSTGRQTMLDAMDVSI